MITKENAQKEKYWNDDYRGFILVILSFIVGILIGYYM